MPFTPSFLAAPTRPTAWGGVQVEAPAAASFAARRKDLDTDERRANISGEEGTALRSRDATHSAGHVISSSRAASPASDGLADASKSELGNTSS
jgi:hypothetical protein